MIPPIIQQQLGALRRRERFLEFTWGLARWLALILGFILLACGVDYLFDRFDETPRLVHLLLFFGLLGLGIGAGGLLLFLAARRRLDDEELALWVEDQTPRLWHRLISAVQLNREGAELEGMSRELIVVVTREAEQHAERIVFPAVADHRRLKWSAAVALPALFLAAMPLLIIPGLSMILLSRLFLSDQEIPRRVALTNITEEVWPQGETVILKVRAKGSVANDIGSLVVVQAEISDRYPLELDKHDPATGEAVFQVEVPASSADFTFQAYLGDGRLRSPGKVHFEPRPVVVAQHAWMVLPDYCDKNPDGQPYEIEQPRAEVVGIPQSSVKVRARIQKPVTWAAVEILGADPDPTAEEPNRRGPERVFRKMDARAETTSDGVWVEARFTPQENETAYRILVRDKHEFDNKPPPRRTLRIIDEEPPTVSLLRDQLPDDGLLSKLAQLSSADDFDLEGLPILPGGRFRIAYTCAGPFGLGRAQLMYRIVRKRESGEEPVDEKWQKLSLKESAAGEGAGQFDLRKGAFANSKASVDFYPIPSFDPPRILGRTLGGGSFDFQTKSLLDGKGGFTSPKEGDQLEYYIEVFASRDPDSKRPSAKSETRVKNVVSLGELFTWIDDVTNQEQRIRQLNTRQEDVFPPRK